MSSAYLCLDLYATLRYHYWCPQKKKGWDVVYDQGAFFVHSESVYRWWVIFLCLFWYSVRLWCLYANLQLWWYRFLKTCLWKALWHWVRWCLMFEQSMSFSESFVTLPGGSSIHCLITKSDVLANTFVHVWNSQ